MPFTHPNVSLNSENVAEDGGLNCENVPENGKIGFERLKCSPNLTLNGGRDRNLAPNGKCEFLKPRFAIRIPISRTFNLKIQIYY